MKPNNFISRINQSIDTHIEYILQILITSIALLFASSPLFLSNPQNNWYLPPIGVLLFTYALCGIHRLKHWLLKITNHYTKNNSTEEYDYIRPIMITNFGKQNIENNRLFKTIA